MIEHPGPGRICGHCAARVRADHEHKRIQREAAKSMAAQGYPTTCQGVRYGDAQA
jgi:hypothetical protein